MRRFWLALIPAFLVVSVVCAADEAETLAALKKLGGTILFHGGDPNKGVRSVYLPGKKVSDSDLKQLANLPKMEELYLDSASNITDEGVKQLAGLKQLTRLGLGSTKVTDAGIKSLTGLSNLEYLALSFDEVTDASVPNLAALKNLKMLGLSFTKVTPEGVKKLQDALPKCRIVK